MMWSTRQQHSHTPSTLSHSSEWTQIDQWLRTKYQGEDVPVFERTEASAKKLLELQQLNETEDKHARQAIVSLQQLSTSYRSEDIKLKENLQILGLQKDLLSTESQVLLSQLSDLAMLLGTSDTSLASFHNSLAQLHLDNLHYSTQQREQSLRIDALKKSQLEAKAGLDRLLELKRRLTVQRDTEGDIEQRTRRRSAELSRIKANEDKDSLRKLQIQQSSDQDVEVQELTLAHLASKEKSVADLERQLGVQSKKLVAYQEIPPDYMLAKLKLQEATLQLNELTAEHESMMTELANEL
ncbi:hypothetical protein EDD21DRAFT_235885 [Dissophora ornata]|nr:hypothetical protein EDD21DRAFT_235885 [Dissophora ornata]